jgi:hypothetical protein
LTQLGLLQEAELEWEASARPSRDGVDHGGIRKTSEDIDFQENAEELPEGSQHLFTGEAEPLEGDYHQRKVDQRARSNMRFLFAEKRQYAHKDKHIWKE